MIDAGPYRSNEMFLSADYYATLVNHAIVCESGSLIPRLVELPTQPHRRSTHPQSRREHLVP